jgi:hypothetical protein
MTSRNQTPAQIRQLETLRLSCEARRAASADRGPIDQTEDFELNPVRDVFVAELLPSDDVIDVSLPDLIFDAYRFQRSAKSA